MKTSARPSIFICRHGEREDYQWKARGENWQAQALRPWDSPLTAGGHRQGAAAGHAIKAHCERLGLAPVRMVLVSPLLRCVQTGSAAAESLGVRELGITTALAEAMSEDWYRSWALPGADSTWGGHAGMAHPKGTDPAEVAAGGGVHHMALEPSGRCLANAAELSEMLVAHGDNTAKVLVEGDGRGVLAASTLNPELGYKWGDFEGHDALTDRMSALCDEIRAAGPRLWGDGPKKDRAPGETGEAEEGGEAEPFSVLLISHGGPTTYLYPSLTGIKRHPSTGYTGLYCYTWKHEQGGGAARPAGDDDGREEGSSGGGWECLVCADHEHLKHVAGATMSGPNDMVEQAHPDAPVTTSGPNDMLEQAPPPPP